MPPESLAMLIGAAVFGAFGVYVWLRRTSPASKGLLLVLAAGVWYMATYALELSSLRQGGGHAWGDLKYLGICLLPPAWLAFTLQYTGRTHWLTRRLLFLLSVEPLIVLTLLAIPATHDLIRVYSRTTNAERFPIVDFGPIGWINVTYSYTMTILSTGLFVKRLAGIARPYRRQARALIAALLVPFALNILYNFNMGPFGRVDLTPFAFTLAVIVLVWGIFRLRLLDILPIARSRVVETMQDGVVVLDAYQRVIDLNPAAQRILRCSAGQAVGRSIQQLVSDHVSLLARSGGSVTGPAEVRLRPGTAPRDFEITFSSIPDDQGRESGRLMVLRDITERKVTEERLERMAHYDSLTGLPNRKLFSDRLSQSIIRARRHGGLVGLMFLDVDDFKDINDTLGHDVGDALLQVLATRLQECVRAVDTVARLSGDEFTVIVVDIHTPTDASLAATRILEALRLPIVASGHELHVTASIGICLWPTDGEDSGTLLRNADVAMYRAKAHGRNRFQFYDAKLRSQVASRLELEHGLRRALTRRELRVNYQPIVSLETGGLDSFEALVRWQHPKRGLMLPAQFLWRAEESELIEAIGQWVLEESCGDLRTWTTDRGSPSLRVAVNVSARQLKRPDFPTEVADTIERAGLEPARLILEISESVVMDDSLTAAASLHDLRGLGVMLSLDDFGTGSTALSQLRHFPLDIVKIDRLFVQGLGGAPEDTVIVQAMVSLAHALGMSVVAEGVETPSQRKTLQELGCDLMQGFLISRPMPGAHVPGFLNAASLLGGDPPGAANEVRRARLARDPPSLHRSSVGRPNVTGATGDPAVS